MKTTLIIVTGVILVGSAGVVLNAARAARTAQADRTALEEKDAHVAAEIRLAEERLAVAEYDEKKWSSISDGSQNANVTVPAELAPTMSARELSDKIEARKLREMSRNPALQLSLLAGKRGRLAMNLGMYHILGFTSAQIEKFLDISMKRVEKTMDLGALVDQGIVAHDDPAVMTLSAEALAEEAAGLRDLLGEAGYQRLQEYNRTSVARGIISGSAAVAVMAGIPFTAEQLEQLVRVVVNGSPSYRSGGAVKEAEMIDWDAVDAQARSILSDAQWTLFRTTSNPIGYNRASTEAYGAIAKAVQADATRQSTKRPGG